jgi:hypothetical protein
MSMEVILASIIIAIPTLFVLTLLGLERYKHRKALTEAAEILELDVIGSTLGLPRLEGEVDGVRIVVEKLRPSVKGSLIFALASIIKYGLGGHEGPPNDRHRYDGRFGSIRISADPTGLPPELEMIPVEAVSGRALEGDSHTLRGNVERVFDIDATEDRFADAVLESRDVMETLWLLHKEFASARCQHGTLEVALTTPGSGPELAEKLRLLADRSVALEEAFARNPIWT